MIKRPDRQNTCKHSARRGGFRFFASFYAVPMLLATFCAVAAPNPAKAAIDLPGLCETAANASAAEFGVPINVLRAVALAESGRTRKGAFRPWPWAVNMDGKGTWFEAAANAQAHLQASLERGVRNFDVGCFQISYRWHGQNFASIAEMLQPKANVRYAAKYLKRLHAVHGEWDAAIGAYHSSTPEKAERYLARVARLRDQLETRGDPETGPARRVRPPLQNGFPLLQVTGLQPRLGSLVPILDNSSERPPVAGK